MKLRIAALAAFFMSVAIIASADEIDSKSDSLYMPNASDGFLTLTSEPCGIPDKAAEFPHKATNEDDQGNVMEGCWNINQETPEGAFKVVQVYMVEMSSPNIGVFKLSLFGPEKKRWTDQPSAEPNVKATM